MSQQDEVESTGGSDAAEPLDAADELTAGDGSTRDSRPGVNGESSPGAELGDSDEAEPVDEFDEIVRNAGVGEPADEPPAGEIPGPAGNGAAEVLEPAGVAAKSAGSRAGARGGAPARTPKTAATAKRDQPVKRERTTPLKFIRQSIGELRKVVYPTSQQLINYFIVVLVFVLFVIAYVSLLDLGLGAAIFRIFS